MTLFNLRVVASDIMKEKTANHPKIDSVELLIEHDSDVRNVEPSQLAQNIRRNKRKFMTSNGSEKCANSYLLRDELRNTAEPTSEIPLPSGLDLNIIARRSRLPSVF